MKDAYSFDRDFEGLDQSYKEMYDAYDRIFTRCGLTFRPVEADTGAIGGSNSHEFTALSEVGRARSHTVINVLWRQLPREQNVSTRLAAMRPCSLLRKFIHREPRP